MMENESDLFILECDCTVLLTNYPFVHCAKARKELHMDYRNLILNSPDCIGKVNWQKYAESVNKKFVYEET
jgi:hypothetical protein